jgi:diguanylate cyclase (GGDEF)-like protein
MSVMAPSRGPTPLDAAAFVQGRILLVDDDHAVRKSFFRSVSSRGFDLDVADDGVTALRMAGEQNYAVFVVDLQMTPLSGLDVIEQLRRIEPTATCVLITGEEELNLPTDRPGTQAISDIIHKPWNDDEVAVSLRRALRLYRARNTGEYTSSESSPEHPILLIEDDLADAHQILSLLDAASRLAGHRVHHATRLSDALVFLKTQACHVALVDLSLPDAMGLDTVTNVRLASPGTPIIVLTRVPDDALAIQAIEAGAQDYLVKADLNPRSLVRAIHYVTERKKADERLAYLAHYDQLTGLANRTLFREKLERAISFAKRNGTEIAMLLLDLDSFKVANDTLGHDTGDDLLRTMSARLVHTARETDTLARLGGDEFAVIMHGVTEIDTVAGMAGRLSENLALPISIGERELTTTTSIGIALYPSDAKTIEELVKCADLAMYRAKERGRNNFQFYSEELTAKAARYHALSNDLRQAIRRKEFCLHYQPVVHLKSGRILGMEALLRWRRHQQLVLPNDFTPTLEETGLIVPVGEWAIREACSQLREWHAAGYDELVISVNLSPRQFRQENLGRSIIQVLEETALPPKSLQIEITESVVMEDTKATIATLRELKQLGVLIAIDDFGTGYSSLAYLQKLPVDVLKIDRTFIKGIPQHDDGTLAKAIIGLAHSLGLKAIAEGIESEEQKRLVAVLGCEAFQGYLYSHPLPAEQCAALLQQRYMPR